MVLIPVSVTDARNHPVVGIDARQFRIFDGKVEQQIVTVATDDSPLSVGIVLDGSASMKGKLEKAREAVIEFLKSANPDDEFFLVNFAETAEVAVPFTTSGPEIQSRLMYATNKGKDRPAGCCPLGDGHHEGRAQSAQGAADHLRWRR